jgi:putative cell wall-binding protein
MSTIACTNVVYGNYIIPGAEYINFNTNYAHIELLSDFKYQATQDSAGNPVQRIYGSNRYETSYATADAIKKILGIEKFDNIIVASGTNFPDALSGSYLANVKMAPILLVNDKYMHDTAEYITNNLRVGGTVYILGGTEAVSKQVDVALSQYTIKRLSGSTRYETNLKILKESGIYNNEILVCAGTGYADSISASATGKPILLVGSTLTDAQKKLFSFFVKYKFIIVGGTSAVSKDIENELKTYGVVERLNGSNRYETSILVANRFFNNPNYIVLTYAENFPDGLCGGVLACVKNAPMVLVSTCYEKYADDYTGKYNITSGTIIGGKSLISDKSANIIFTDEGFVGHNYKEIVTLPTCTSSGYVTHVCSKCGASYRGKTISPVEHNYIVTKVEATTGWGGYDLYECVFCERSYKKNETPKLQPNEYPKGYRDSTCEIVIYKEWYENAYVYAAHIKFSNYKRLWVECANGKYNSGVETTSHAARRVGAILAINGDYAVPGNGAGGYAIARNGVVYNDKRAYPEGVYNNATGLLTFGHSGRILSDLVADGLVTDTFQFAPVCLLNGKIQGNPNSNGRAQRTFIGTNCNAGDIWLCVSDGRYNDGKSAGLNGYQCGAYLKSKGCTLGVPLDGGGSSTIWFNGEVLNAAKSGQRAVVDFLCFK